MQDVEPQHHSGTWSRMRKLEWQGLSLESVWRAASCRTHSLECLNSCMADSKEQQSIHLEMQENHWHVARRLPIHAMSFPSSTIFFTPKSNGLSRLALCMFMYVNSSKDQNPVVARQKSKNLTCTQVTNYLERSCTENLRSQQQARQERKHLPAE